MPIKSIIFILYSVLRILIPLAKKREITRSFYQCFSCKLCSTTGSCHHEEDMPAKAVAQSITYPVGHVG